MTLGQKFIIEWASFLLESWAGLESGAKFITKWGITFVMCFTYKVERNLQGSL